MFRVQGQVYHFINELLPSIDYPSYLQLCFYDSEHEIENRLRLSNKMDSSTVQKLINILKVNPYSNLFWSLKDIPNLENCKIALRFDIS